MDVTTVIRDAAFTVMAAVALVGLWTLLERYACGPLRTRRGQRYPRPYANKRVCMRRAFGVTVTLGGCVLALVTAHALLAPPAYAMPTTSDLVGDLM